MKIDTKPNFYEESDFTKFYGNRFKLQIEINRERLINESKLLYNGIINKDTKNLRKKIKSACERFNYVKSDESVILTKIIEGDETYQKAFMIDPKRQNSSSSYGQEFLQKIYIQKKLDNNFGKIFNMEKLPSQGNDAYRIINGQILKGVPKNTDTSKSLDFKIHNPYGLEIYTVNKITTSSIEDNIDSGGAQSNQLELAEKGCNTIDFTDIINQNKYIILIFDGNFYLNNRYIFQLIDKYKDNKHIYITTADGIEKVIRSILHNK
jgi:hypothetical protein